MSASVLPLAQQTSQLKAAFESRFGRPAKFAVAAPGRVNLIGEHTDYNDGFVLPMAIERQTVIVADRRPDNLATIRSTQDADAVQFEVSSKLKKGSPKWANYVKGVVKGCIDAGLTPPAGTPAGFDALIDSTVPIGGGLSSSASLEVATATLMEALVGKKLYGVKKALIAQYAEHTFAGVPCGIMDQFISTMGREGCAMLLDCRSHETRMVKLADPNLVVLIANTNVRHELSGCEYAQRRGQCENAAELLKVKALRDAKMADLDKARSAMDEVVYRRARHVIGEIARTTRAADEMDKDNWKTVGELMFQSHASLRDDYEVSCSELDVMVELAGEMAGKGVYGSRMTGGGFGGCTVSLVESRAVEAVTRHLELQYKDKTGIAPSLFATRPAAGARAIAL